jgi:hypothetical protein
MGKSTDAKVRIGGSGSARSRGRLGVQANVIHAGTSSKYKKAGTLVPACVEQKTFNLTRSGKLPADQPENRERSTQQHGRGPAIRDRRRRHQRRIQAILAVETPAVDRNQLGQRAVRILKLVPSGAVNGPSTIKRRP